jgi:hypothetical protein
LHFWQKSVAIYLPPQFGTEINVSIRATQEIEEGLYTRTCFEQFNYLLDTEPGLLTGERQLPNGSDENLILFSHIFTRLQRDHPATKHRAL